MLVGLKIGTCDPSVGRSNVILIQNLSVLFKTVEDYEKTKGPIGEHDRWTSHGDHHSFAVSCQRLEKGWTPPSRSTSTMIKFAILLTKATRSYTCI